MITFNKVLLHNFVLYRKAEFQFDSGLTFVGGENQAGKSLLFSSIRAGLYSKELNTKLPESSSFEFHYSAQKDKKLIDYELGIKTNKSARYTFFQNGKDKKPHKITDALNLIKTSFPIPLQLFDSTVYLRALKEHPLTKGTPAVRSEWLAEVLDLITVYDDYHAQVKTRLEELSKKQVAHSVLKEELEDLSIPKKVSKEKYISNKEELDKVTERLQEISEQRIQLSNTLTMLETLPSCNPISEKEYSKAKAKIKGAQKSIAEILDDLDQWKDYEESIDSYKQQQRLYTKISKALKEVQLNNKVYRKWVNILKEMQDNYISYQENLEEWEKQSDLRAFLQKYGDLKVSKSSTIERLQEIKQEQAYLEQHGLKLRSLADLGKNCPTCGGKLNSKHVEHELKALQSHWKRLEEARKRVDLETRLITAKNTPKIKKPENPVEKDEIIRIRQILSRFEEYLDIQVEELQPPETSKEKLKKTRDYMREKIKEYEKLIEAYQSQASVKTFPPEIQSIFENGSSSVKSAIKSNRKKLEKYEDEMNKLSDTRDSLQVEITNYKANKLAYQSAKSKHDDLTDKIQSLQLELVDVEPLKALLHAFGNSGLRLQQLNESADLLSSKMTEFSPLFFNQPYTFDMEVAQRKLNLNINRNGITSTLDTMSGSESRFFNVLFGIALLHLIPNRLRADTIVLDEIDSMLDSKSRERYAKDILPEVKNHADKVIVVSPLISGELNVHADRSYRITKRFIKGRWISEITPA